MASGAAPIDGARLAAQGAWLSLLLRHLAGRRVRAHVEVEDLVQEVFVRAILHPTNLPDEEDGEAPLRRYLAVLARRTVIDVARCIRARKRDATLERLTRSDWSEVGVRDSQVPQDGAGPVTWVQRAEDQARLAAAFDGLSPEHRRVLGLRQLEGLTAEQAGQRMGRSASAVHSLYRRALQAWHAAMELDGTSSPLR